MEQKYWSIIEELYNYYKQQFRLDMRGYFVQSTPGTISCLENNTGSCPSQASSGERLFFPLFFLLNIILQKTTLDVFGEEMWKDVAKALKLPLIKELSEHPEADPMVVLGAAHLSVSGEGIAPDHYKSIIGDSIEIIYKEVETGLQLKREDDYEMYCRLKEEFNKRAWELLNPDVNKKTYTSNMKVILQRIKGDAFSIEFQDSLALDGLILQVRYGFNPVDVAWKDYMKHPNPRIDENTGVFAYNSAEHKVPTREEFPRIVAAELDVIAGKGARRIGMNPLWFRDEEGHHKGGKEADDLLDEAITSWLNTGDNALKVDAIYIIDKYGKYYEK